MRTIAIRPRTAKNTNFLNETYFRCCYNINLPVTQCSAMFYLSRTKRYFGKIIVCVCVCMTVVPKLCTLSTGKSTGIKEGFKMDLEFWRNKVKCKNFPSSFPGYVGPIPCCRLSRQYRFPRPTSQQFFVVHSDAEDSPGLRNVCHGSMTGLENTVQTINPRSLRAETFREFTQLKEGNSIELSCDNTLRNQFCVQTRCTRVTLYRFAYIFLGGKKNPHKRKCLIIFARVKVPRCWKMRRKTW